MNQPLISVIVPCYNQAQYMDECLQSVLDQTYQNWECIIVNDGSPDDTEEVALRWVEKDTRFIYLKKENGGLSSARNAGIEVAKGEWIQFLDCDDKITLDKFQMSSMYFDKYDIIFSEYSLQFDDKVVINFKNQFINYIINFESIILNWDLYFTIPIHCAIIKNKNIPLFNNEMKAKEDLVFWIQLFKIVRTYFLIEQKQAIYRLNETSMTRNISHMQKYELKAYEFIYNELIIEDELKKRFFIEKIFYLQKINKDLQEKIIEKEEHYLNVIEKIKNSKRYRLGDKIATIYDKILRK